LNHTTLVVHIQGIHKILYIGYKLLVTFRVVDALVVVVALIVELLILHMLVSQSYCLRV